MPLEPIASPAPSRSDRKRLSRRALIGVGAAATATVLVSCAQGTSREAERGKERDAERTWVVDALQATTTARLVQATPPATPSDDS